MCVCVDVCVHRCVCSFFVCVCVCVWVCVGRDLEITLASSGLRCCRFSGCSNDSHCIKVPPAAREHCGGNPFHRLAKRVPLVALMGSGHASADGSIPVLKIKTCKDRTSKDGIILISYLSAFDV